jgi:hypothetical protein
MCPTTFTLERCSYCNGNRHSPMQCPNIVTQAFNYAPCVKADPIPIPPKPEEGTPTSSRYLERAIKPLLSPDLAAKHASTSISPKGQQWESTGTTPTVNAPTVVEYTTRLLNAQSSSRKHSIMHHTSRRILSRYLQSLRKARPLLTTTQSVRSSLYHGGQGNLGPN